MERKFGMKKRAIIVVLLLLILSACNRDRPEDKSNVENDEMVILESQKRQQDSLKELLQKEIDSLKRKRDSLLTLDSLENIQKNTDSLTSSKKEMRN